MKRPEGDPTRFQSRCFTSKALFGVPENVDLVAGETVDTGRPRQDYQQLRLVVGMTVEAECHHSSPACLSCLGLSKLAFASTEASRRKLVLWHLLLNDKG